MRTCSAGEKLSEINVATQKAEVELAISEQKNKKLEQELKGGGSDKGPQDQGASDRIGSKGPKSKGSDDRGRAEAGCS